MRNLIALLVLVLASACDETSMVCPAPTTPSEPSERGFYAEYHGVATLAEDTQILQRETSTVRTTETGQYAISILDGGCEVLTTSGGGWKPASTDGVCIDPLTGEVFSASTVRFYAIGDGYVVTVIGQVGNREVVYTAFGTRSQDDAL